jgi:NADPH2:quinone reductase
MKSRSLGEKIAMTERFSGRWLGAFEMGALKPIVGHVYPLKQAADAHRDMERSGSLGKIILSMD